MSIDNKMKIGIIGCGTIADVHAQAIRESRNADLVFVYSRNENNAKRVGEKHKTNWTTDWDRFISNKNIDAVSICTPNGNHLDYGKKVAEAGKHVIMEKPIEVTLARGKELITICQNNGVKLAIIYQNRFLPEVKRMKQQIDAGKIGKIFMGDAYIKWYRTQEYYDSGAWRGTIAMDGGGVLINQAIHTIDLLQWFMGDVDTIFGQIGTFSHERLEGEDNAVATILFKNGSIGVIEASTSIQPAQGRRIEIHGDKGSAILDGDSVRIWSEDDKSEVENQGRKESITSAGASSPLSGFSIEPHKNQFETIVDAISRDEDPLVSGQESLKSLAIVLAIYESHRTKSPVNFEEFMK